MVELVGEFSGKEVDVVMRARGGKITSHNTWIQRPRCPDSNVMPELDYCEIRKSLCNVQNVL